MSNILNSAAVAAEPQEFTNLRHFNSNSKIRHVTFLNNFPLSARQRRHVHAQSSTGLDVLRTAEQLNPQAPIVALETLPPFEEWHRHPELLTG